MTTWITRDLALDLLAITIDWLNKTFDRINQDSPPPTVTAMQPPVPDPATTHPADLPAARTPITEATPEPVEDTPEPTQPDPEPEHNPQLLAEAQDHLRRLAQTEGIDWIRDTLFPHFQVESLTDVPAGRLPELIGMVEAKTEQAAA